MKSSEYRLVNAGCMSEALTWPSTVLLPPEAPACTTPDALGEYDALSPGTRLDEFEIVRVLGAGGFGIVYLALDNVLLRHVAIKEYMPSALAGRGKGTMVSVRSASHAETFANGLESFFSEARLLASFDHPSLVKVHRFWKANDTGYMAMQYYPGQTLKEARSGMSASPDEAWLRAFVEPLLGALELLHGEGVYHRDIAPDNILLLPDGRPVLLDFGSARRVIGDSKQSLTAVLKPNFAPVEQYADEAAMRQGPWTDLYALGATVHFMLTGQVPAPAVMRAVCDVLPALSAPESALFPGVSTQFLAAIDWTLALPPDGRPQSVASLRQAFSGEVVPPLRSPCHASVPHLPAVQADEDPTAAEPTVLDPTAAPIPATAIVTPSQREAVPASMRSRGVRATLIALGLTGLGTLGFGAWTWGPLSSLSPEAASTGATAVPTVETTTIVAAPPHPSPAAPTPRDMRTPAPPVPTSRPRAVSATALSARAAKPVGVRHQTAEVPAANSKLAAVLSSPKAACGDRNFFAVALCVSRECKTPQWREHPHCVEARRIEDQRQRRMEQ